MAGGGQKPNCNEFHWSQLVEKAFHSFAERGAEKWAVAGKGLFKDKRHNNKIITCLYAGET